MKFELKEDGKRLAVIAIAALIMAINIKTFVRIGGLYPGGVSGLTVLLQRIGIMLFDFEAPYTAINILLNAIPVYIGFRYLGKKFTLYSCLMIVLSSVLTDLIPAYSFTSDILLISVFGGLINGLSVSLCLMMGATSGGTDFVSIFLSERRGIDSWNIILGVNAVIIGIAGVLFGWDKALYSIIFQYVSTQVLRFMYRKYQQHTLFIVTNMPGEVCRTIQEECNHGATVLNGTGAYENHKRYVVYSIVSRQETKKVVAAVKRADEKAFINVVKTDQLTGKFYKRPND